MRTLQKPISRRVCTSFRANQLPAHTNQPSFRCATCAPYKNQPRRVSTSFRANQLPNTQTNHLPVRNMRTLQKQQPTKITHVGFARLFVRTNYQTLKPTTFSVRNMHTLQKPNAVGFAHLFVRTNYHHNQTNHFSGAQHAHPTKNTPYKTISMISPCFSLPVIRVSPHTF